MARISTLYGLSNSQASLDFIDVDVSTDTPLYVDPYAIQIRHDNWSELCGDHIRSFFNQLLDVLREGNMRRAKHLLSHLHEPNETFLGQSRGVPRGRGVGNQKAALLAKSLINSKAFKTGLLTDISEAELFIHGVGKDTISDLTTNIIRGLLSKYTKEQCGIHGIPTQIVRNIGPAWDVGSGDWQATAYELPVSRGKPILLVPKFSVRRRLSLDSQEFWNHHMIEFLRQEYLDSGSSLVQVLKKGGGRVTKKKVKERHPFIKDSLADFVRSNPHVLERYKEIRGALGPLESEDFEIGFDERVFAQTLKLLLQEIPEGNADASRYHTFCLGACTFLFYPSLIFPIKELEIHQGRKRVDIKFTNSAERGFFQTLLASAQTRATSVLIECKNYEKQINNPELDQLSGRFGHQRGFFGILMCRRMDDRARIVSRCKDAASDGRGFMLALEDRDINAMLDLVISGNRHQIDQFLSRKYDEIIH